MFDLESTARRLTNCLLKNNTFDTVQKDEVEYGLSLLLGVVIELVLTLVVATIFGTAFYTLLIMLSALFLRLFTGGAHCSSFRRCLVFTMVFFIGLSIPVKVLTVSMEFRRLMWISLFLVLIALPFIWKPQCFTLLLWMICASLPIWGLFSVSEVGWRILIFPVTVGIVIQAFILSSFGYKVVLLCDKVMQRLRI